MMTQKNILQQNNMELIQGHYCDNTVLLNSDLSCACDSRDSVCDFVSQYCEVLCTYPLPTSGNKAAIANRLYQYFHTSHNMHQQIPMRWWYHPMNIQYNQQCKYVDFSTLLRKAMFFSSTEPDHPTSFMVQLPSGSGDLSVHPSPKLKKIIIFVLMDGGLEYLSCSMYWPYTIMCA